MKNLFRNQIQQGVLLVVAMVVILASCNKDIPGATPIAPPPATGTQTIAQIIAANPSYSFLAAAITRAGTGLSFNPADPTAVYTLFAPNDAAFIASGIPSIAVINSLPQAQVAAIVNYHVIPGLLIKSTDISTAFPNMYLQSTLVLSPTPPVPYRMSIFPSRRTAGAWVNNIPIVATDAMASNGVIHGVARLISPPSQVIAQIASADTSLTYLMAALARADAGPPPGAPQLIPIVSNAAANLTVFAPTNQAFRNLFTALGLPTGISTIGMLPTQQVWGIVAFHVLSTRVFAANLPAGTSTAPSIMGVAQQYRVALPLVEVRGPGNVLPTTPPTQFYGKVTTADVHAINGVVHIVDAVLVPQ
jgi:uncharacterized surface protein with fasciclin (FAS1) repeats